MYVTFAPRKLLYICAHNLYGLESFENWIVKREKNTVDQSFFIQKMGLDFIYLFFF